MPAQLPGLVARLRAAGCVFAEDEAALLEAEAGTVDELAAMAVRRVAGEPLEQVLGWAAFCGLRVVVEPGVFVPRRRTELMVTEALRLVPPAGVPVVVDLCCGSGAVGAALAAALGAVDLYAADLDPPAVHCARRNLDPARVFEGDLFDPLPSSLRGRVDVLAVNTPYVPSDAIATMPAEARDHEPALALDGGVDGLAVARRVATEAPDWLRAGGAVLVETSRTQATVLAGVFASHGLLARVATSKDLDATLVIGAKP